MKWVKGMKRARLIYNPSSGREEVKKNLPQILDRLEHGGYETSCHATQAEGDAVTAAAKAAERDFDLVIAAGGDGTIYEVVNGLAEQTKRPRLGIIPAGTTNDFARAIHIPRNMEKACEIIVNGDIQPVDVGKMNDKYFINIAGIGSVTKVTYEVPSKMKTMLGQLAYYVKGAEILPFLSPTRVRIETSERILEEDIMLFLIANSCSVGGFERLFPEADLSDGLFDCLLVKQTALPDFVRLVRLAVKGQHLSDPSIVHFRTDRLSITSTDGEVLLNLDGEQGGPLPCDFEVLTRHIELMVPAQTEESR